jgi:hypothetical protein
VTWKRYFFPLQLLPLQLVPPLQLVFPLQLVPPLQLVLEPSVFSPLQLVLPLQLVDLQPVNVNPVPVSRLAILNPARIFLSPLLAMFRLLLVLYDRNFYSPLSRK